MKTSYPLLLSALIVLCQSFIPAQAGIVSGRLDEFYLGSWACMQHNAICAQIYPSVMNGKLKTINADNKQLNKEQALRLLEDKVIAFVSTSSTDPTAGYDTTYFAPRTSHFHSFVLTEKEVMVKTGLNSQTMVFSLSEFNSLLNTDMRLYLDFYKTGQEVLYSSIPARSSVIMRDINIKLHKEGKSPSSKVYRTDSLTGLYSQEEKDSRGITEYPAFISTDPDDLSVGRDTTVVVQLEESMKDSSRYQTLFFAMHGSASHLKLTGLSAGYMVSVGGFGLSLHYGFLEYGSIKSLSSAERALVESSLVHLIEDRVLPFGNGYTEYLENFSLIDIAEAKKVR